MKIDVFKIFKNSFDKYNDKRDKAIEEKKLVLLNKKEEEYQKLIMKEVFKKLEEGVPLTELRLVLEAIVYLYFDGIIHETDEVIFQLHDEILNGSIDKKVISKINEIQSFPFEIKKTDSIYGTRHYIPYYMLQKKAGDFCMAFIDRARKWVKEHPNADSAIWRGNGHFTWSVWLEGNETPPHEKLEWQKVIRNTESQYFHDKQCREYPIYGGRPRDVLSPNRPELQDKFWWWSQMLFSLLTPNEHALEFQGNKEYEEVALEVGKLCLKYLPQAKELLNKTDLTQLRSSVDANGQSDYGAFDHELNNKKQFENNRGLVKYVKLLVDMGDLNKAIYVCEQCIKYGVHDGTKSGFQGRIKSIKNKMAKQSPKIESRGRKGILNDDQIQQLVVRYLSSNSEERKLLPKEYGITSANLYYLVSKNRHKL